MMKMLKETLLLLLVPMNMIGVGVYPNRKGTKITHQRRTGLDLRVAKDYDDEEDVHDQ